MSRYSFFDVLVQLVQGFPLGEDILPNSASAPELAIEIGFHFYQHASPPCLPGWLYYNTFLALCRNPSLKGSSTHPSLTF